MDVPAPLFPAGHNHSRFVHLLRPFSQPRKAVILSEAQRSRKGALSGVEGDLRLKIQIQNREF
jgi:hypothetical protein